MGQCKSFSFNFRLLFFTIGLLWGLFLHSGKSFAQAADKDYPSHIVLWRASASAAVFAASGLGLYVFADDAYYQDRRSSFHWARLSDGRIDWFDNYYRGMDKFGHIYSASLFAENFYVLARWSGFSRNQSNWIAPSASAVILSAMEFWDAHFVSWGFSPGDFTANLVGASFPVLQKNLRFFRALDYKMSYDFRPSQATSEGAHDYTRMTFWLSANPVMLHKSLNTFLPEWLNLALGVSLESYQNRRREIFIAPDINFKNLAPKGFFLRQIFRILDRFHLPLPAVRVAPHWAFYLIYY